LKKLLIIFLIFFFNQNSFSKEKLAYFAGGCFWCMEPVFDKLEGVNKVVSGYSGGTVDIETVKVSYDPKKITYSELLKNFWVNIDPYDGYGQFCDRGKSYSSAIFYQDEQEKKLIDQSIKELKSIKINKIKTSFTEFKNFYPAEDYHQQYYKKNPSDYFAYVIGCRRMERLKEVWK
jgi:methionine-S-sulfoxide reductase